VTDSQEPTQYLTITGVLHPDNRLVLEPGFLTTEPDHAVEDPDSTLVAELVDESGKPLLRFRLSCALPCTDGAAFADRLVIGKVPFPPSTRMLRFALEGVIVHELEVPRDAPTVRLSWDPGEGVDGVGLVRWHGEHPEGIELRYLLSYSADDGRTWQPLSLPVLETEHEVDFDRLAGGSRCRLRVLASDGVNTTAAISDSFERPTQPCYAMILEPEDGATFGRDEPVRLQGQGYYLEEREPERELLEWRSSVDGPLGTGAIVEVTGLSRGAHTINLAAGREGRTGITEVTIQVG
jgi:hypothetical protein